ncbi:MAG: hypothetical protein IT370_30185 [Deltaproteobacteria bacterium]|nr:hypothetical protein [Deltaproteobacteria bacterium]
MGKWSLLGLLGLALAACGNGGGGPAPTGADIGPEGGTLTSADGVNVSVPAGAVAGVTRFTITEVSAGPGQLPAGVRALGKTYRLEPEGVRFAALVRISLPVPASSAAHGVLLLRRPAPSASWLPIGNAGAGAAVVSGATAELSTYTVAEVDGLFEAAACTVTPDRCDLTCGPASCSGSCSASAAGATLTVGATCSTDPVPGDPLRVTCACDGGDAPPIHLNLLEATMSPAQALFVIASHCGWPCGGASDGGGLDGGNLDGATPDGGARTPVVSASTALAPAGMFPALSFDNVGNAIAVYYVAASKQLMSRHYTRASTSWSAPRALPAGTEPPGLPWFTPRVCLADDGAAVAVWTVTGSATPYPLWASRHDPGSGTWSPAVRLGDSAYEDAFHLRCTTQGAAVALWQSSPQTNNDFLLGARWDGNAWSAPTELFRFQSGVTDEAMMHFGLELGRSGKGFAFLQTSGYLEAGTPYDRLLVRRIDGGWGAANVEVAREPGGSMAPMAAALALDETDDVIAVYARSVDVLGSPRVRLFESAYAPVAATWSTPSVVATADVGLTSGMALAATLSPSGHAAALIRLEDATRSLVYATRRAPGTAWATLSPLVSAGRHRLVGAVRGPSGPLALLQSASGPVSAHGLLDLGAGFGAAVPVDSATFVQVAASPYGHAGAVFSAGDVSVRMIDW